MTKYKIGDKVRVRKDLKDGKVYRMEVSKVGDTFTNSMEWSRGKEVTIKEITAGGKYHIEGDVGYNYTDEMFECKVNDNKIVITTNGTETLARLYEGNKVVKSTTAKCSPDDTFNFETGAKIAFDRLVGEKPEEKPKYYNGKVVCVKGHVGFTPGKVYEVVDGQFKDDNGCLRPTWGKMTELCEYSGDCFKFIPFVE